MVFSPFADPVLKLPIFYPIRKKLKKQHF